MTKKNVYTMSIAVAVLALVCLFAGYFAGSANTKAKIAQHDKLWSAKLEEAQATRERMRNSYDADIEGLSSMRKSLLDENTQLKEDIATLEGSDYENHSDWLDCYASLKFINEHLDEIESIDATNPVPVIYMKDGRKMCANGSHEIVELNIPEAPTVVTPPPTPSTTEPEFIPNDSFVASLTYLGN